MTTTIQIDEITKKKLFEIKLELEREKGSAVTYNEIINHLLKSKERIENRKKNLLKFREFKGILPKSAKSVYLKNKKDNLSREENLYPLPEK